MWLLRSLLIVSMALFPTGSLRADTFQVTKTADTNDGTCDLDCSLREAIVAANTNPGADDVPVPAGTYLLTLGQLTVSEDVDISGAGESNTIIDGNATNRAFVISSATTVTINTLTIQNGNYFLGGGGIANYGTLTLNNTTVSGNSAGSGGGGGVVNYSGTLTLNNTTVSGNSNSNGGGGGVYNSYGTLTINNTRQEGTSHRPPAASTCSVHASLREIRSRWLPAVSMNGIGGAEGKGMNDAGEIEPVVPIL